MRKMVLCVLALACSLAGGCKKAMPTTESVVDVSEVVKIWTESAAILTTVKDRPTAKEAREKLKLLAQKLKKLTEDYQQRQEEAKNDPALTPPTRSEAVRKQIREARKRYDGERDRVLTVEGGPELIKAFEDEMTPAIVVRKSTEP